MSVSSLYKFNRWVRVHDAFNVHENFDLAHLVQEARLSICYAYVFQSSAHRCTLWNTDSIRTSWIRRNRRRKERHRILPTLVYQPRNIWIRRRFPMAAYIIISNTYACRSHLLVEVGRYKRVLLAPGLPTFDTGCFTNWTPSFATSISCLMAPHAKEKNSAQNIPEENVNIVL